MQKSRYERATAAGSYVREIDAGGLGRDILWVSGRRVGLRHPRNSDLTRHREYETPEQARAIAEALAQDTIETQGWGPIVVWWEGN